MAKGSTYSLGALLFTGLGMWVLGLGMGGRIVANACLRQFQYDRNPRLPTGNGRWG